MKKIFSAIVVAMAMFIATPAQAQGLKFGLKGGFNITSLDIDQGSTAKSLYKMGKENNNGWYIGPTVKFSTLSGIGADGAIFYDQRSNEVSGQKVKQQYIYVPINLRYNIGIGALGSIYVAAGPQIGFNVGDADFDWKSDLAGEITGTSTSLTEYAQNKFQLKKSNFSINLGLGAFVLKHLEVGLVYNIPLGNTADMDTDIVGVAQNIQDKIDVKSNTFQVSAAIYF